MNYERLSDKIAEYKYGRDDLFIKRAILDQKIEDYRLFYQDLEDIKAYMEEDEKESERRYVMTDKIKEIEDRFAALEKEGGELLTRLQSGDITDEERDAQLKRIMEELKSASEDLADHVSGKDKTTQ